MNRDETYLVHIRERIEHIRHCAQSGQDEFLSNITTQRAILYDLQTMAESTKRLSATLKEQFPQIPWQDIADFRNVIVHDYLGLDLSAVWKIIEHDLNDLEVAIEDMLIIARDGQLT